MSAIGHKKRRIAFWTSTIAMLLGIIVATVFWRRPENAGDANLAFEIRGTKKISVQLNQVLHIAGTPRFDVPGRYVSAIIDCFEPAEARELPEPVDEAGSLVFVAADGTQADVRLYFYGTSPVIFTVNGRPFQRGGQYLAIHGENAFLPETLTLHGLLEAIYRETQGIDESPAIQRCIRLLKLSAGRQE